MSDSIKNQCTQIDPHFQSQEARQQASTASAASAQGAAGGPPGVGGGELSGLVQGSTLSAGKKSSSNAIFILHLL